MIIWLVQEQKLSRAQNMFLIKVIVFLLTDTDRTVLVFMFKCTCVHMSVCLYVTVWVYVCMCWVTDAAGVSVTVCQACKPSLTWSAMVLQVPQHTHTHCSCFSVFWRSFLRSHTRRDFLTGRPLLLRQQGAAVGVICGNAFLMRRGISTEAENDL